MSCVCSYVHSAVASPGCVAHREAVASGAGAAGTFCGHMASPPFDVDAWLGAKWADGDLEVRLTAKIVTLLKIGFGTGDYKFWSKDDVPSQTLPAEQLGRFRKLWVSVLESCAVVAKADLFPIDKLRLDDWVRVIYLQYLRARGQGW